MLGAIKYNLSNLTNFSGRDARQTFWYYVLMIVVLRFAAGMVVTIPMMVSTFTSAFEAARVGVEPAAFQQQINAQTIAMMEQLQWLTIGIGVISGLLLLAALVRRLHDSDHSGWWATLPAVLYTYALWNVPRQVRQAAEIMTSMDPDNPPNPLAMMQGQVANMAITWLPLVVVIVIGSLKSSPGPNRYGDASVSF